MTDSRELAHVESAPPARPSEGLLQQVIAAAKDPSVDAAKMEALVKLVNGQQDRDREIEFNQSKNAAIQEMPVITKDGKIVIRKAGEADRLQGRFARFEDIDRVVRPILQRHNLAMAFDVEERQGGGILVRPILTHANGVTERGGGMPLPADQSGGKNAVQAVGSAVQYGKRYTMCAMLNIQTEGVDDDGNAGRSASVSLPFEREQLVMQEAKAAAEAGRYQEWFTDQSPKDRGWLVASGKHAEFGGQPALPAQKREPDVVLDAEPPPPPPPPAKPPTARQWVDRFKEDVAACKKMDDLDLYMDEARESLDKLKARNEALWTEAQDAYRARKTSLEEGRML